jgi:hypothetical protein
MRKLAVAALAFSLLATVSRGQYASQTDITMGYSVIKVVKGPSLTANGSSAAVSLNLTNWFGAVGDFGVYHTSSGGVGVTAETYTFGPRFSYRHWERVTPFAQVLFGGAHASSANSGFNVPPNAFAFGVGGGADVHLDRAGRFILRPQVEYFGFGSAPFSFSNATDTVRFSVGLVIHRWNLTRRH